MTCRRLTTTLHVVIGLTLIPPIPTELVSYWIWNKGCRKPDSEGLTVNSTVTDPAQCFEHCNNVTNSVALQGTTCQCVENIKPEVHISQPDCLKCGGEPEVHCGNEKRNLWSYYEKVEEKEILSDITDGISTCIAVQYHNGRFLYIGYSCNQKLPFLCYSEIAGECLDYQDSSSWSEAVDWCVDMSSIVINSYTLLKTCESYLHTDNELYWIGLRKVSYIKTETTTESQPTTSLTTTTTTIMLTLTSPSVAQTQPSITTGQQSMLTPTSPSTTATPQSIMTPTSPSRTTITQSITRRRQSITSSLQSKTTVPARLISTALQTTTPLQSMKISTTESIAVSITITALSATETNTQRLIPLITEPFRKTPVSTTPSSVIRESSAQTKRKLTPTSITRRVLYTILPRPEEKPVTDLNPPVASALVVNSNDSDLKTYYAAFGASILVLMIIIALFLGLIHRSVRKLVNKDYLLESRFRHRSKTRSRSPTFLPKRERSPNLGSHGMRAWYLPRVRSRDDARYSAGLNNYGFMWDDRYHGDDSHNDDLDNNALNRGIED